MASTMTFGDKMKQRKYTHSMIERLLYIDSEVRNKKYPNSSKLSKVLEVSVPTISRDIEFLRDRLLAPLKYNYAKKGYFEQREKQDRFF